MAHLHNIWCLHSSPVSSLLSNLVNSNMKGIEEQCELLGGVHMAEISRIAQTLLHIYCTSNGSLHCCTLFAASFSSFFTFFLSQFTCSGAHGSSIFCVLVFLSTLSLSKEGSLSALLPYTAPVVDMDRQVDMACLFLSCILVVKV